MRIPLWRFFHIKRLKRDRSGATIVLVAVMLPLLITVMAVTIDIARLYVVHSKAQNALDTGLLGAVTTETTTNAIQTEARRLFDANFETGYMGASISTNLSVVEASTGVYNGTVSVRVPTTVLSVVGSNLTTFNLFAQVTRGFQNAGQKQLELTLVMDNSSAMTNPKRNGVRNGLNSMMDELFGTNPTLPNVFVSIVPYGVAVNHGVGRIAWVQSNYLFLHLLYNLFLGVGFMSNRNNDSPPNGFTDLSNQPPTTQATRFRMPVGAATFTSGTDLQLALIPEVQFALNNKSQINNAISDAIGSGNRRINVGLMWGWFTQSPSWQGVWSNSLPGLPRNFTSGYNKSLVLITGGRNNVFLGNNGTSNDNNTTALLCQAIKAQGSTLYVVAYGNSGDFDLTLLQGCASSLPNFYLVNNTNQARAAFLDIINDVSFTTVRLTQ